MLHQLMEQRCLPMAVKADHSPEFTFKLGSKHNLKVWSWT